MKKTDNKSGTEEVLINVVCPKGAKYLNYGNNIGHEFINFVKDDTDNNYIYVLPYGTYDNKKHKNITTILNVKRIDVHTLLVLSKATDLTSIYTGKNNAKEEKAIAIEYIKNNNVRYDGVLLNEIFKNNIQFKQQKVYITFKAKTIEKPKETIIIKEKDIWKNGEKKFSSQSSKMYIPVDKLETILIDDKWEYVKLPKLEEKRKLFKKWQSPKSNFVHILGKRYDELSYSNMFRYLFENNRKLFVEFIKEKNKELKEKNIELNENFYIEGEKTLSFKEGTKTKSPRIDLFIEDDKNIIVIENKILSDENGEQLEDYKKAVENYKKAVEKNNESVLKEIYFIFMPNYAKNTIWKDKVDKNNMLKGYVVITYEDLYNFFSGRIFFSKKDKKEYITKDILDALSWHTKEIDNFQEEYMFARLFEQLDNFKNQ